MGDALSRIRDGYARDQQRGAVPVTRATDLPIAYEALTAEWFTDVLCRDVPGAAVTGFSLGAVDNGSSNRRKIRLEYNHAGNEARLPDKLFGKAAHDLANRIALGVSGSGEFEVSFYNHIRPLLDIEATTSVYARIDAESCNSLTLLIDISDQVTAFCDHRTPMSRARVESQMRTLAKLHGAGYTNRAMRAEYGRFADWPSYIARSLTFGLEEGSEAGFQDARDHMPARLFARASEIWPATMRSVALHYDLPQTFCHGDVHLKNWYIVRDDEMGLSDWQCLNIGHWSRDVAYTISTALTVEDRRAWERDLVALYIDELAANGGPATTFDDAMLRYRQQLITALTWWTSTIHPPPGLPDMQPMDTTTEFISRIATALDDNDTLDSLKV